MRSSGVSSNHFLLFKVLVVPIILPALNIPSFVHYSGGAVMYIGVILFLLTSGVLLRFFKRTRNNRMQQQLAEHRSDIFMKITHEFRTTLTIILGLSKQLQEQKDLFNNNSLTYLSAIERQGTYLSELINQLLDIANLHMGDKTMEWKTGNIVSFAKISLETFRLYAEQKEIDLYFFSDEKDIETDFVPDFFNKSYTTCSLTPSSIVMRVAASIL